MTLPIERLIRETTDLLDPLSISLRSPQTLSHLLRRFGCDRSATSLEPVVQGLQPLIRELEDMWVRLEAYEDALEEGKGAVELLSLSDSVVSIFFQLKDIPSQLSLVAIPEGFLNELLNKLLFNHLYTSYPFVYRFLSLIGVVSRRFVALTGNADSRDIQYVRFDVNWNRLSHFLKDQYELAQEIYGWGTPNFQHKLFLQRLGRIFQDLGFDLVADDMSPYLVEKFFPSALTDLEPPWVLNFLLYEEEHEDLTKVELGLTGLPIEGASASDNGIALMPYVVGELATSFAIDENLTLNIEGFADLTGGVIACFRPQSGMSVEGGLNDSSVSAVGRLKIRLIQTGGNSDEIIIFGNQWGSRLSAKRLTTALFVDSADVGVEFEIEQASLVIEASEGDGFLNKILPPDGIRTDFDFGVGWSSLDGFYFRGSAALQVTIPVHQKLGPVKFESIFMIIELRQGGSIGIALAATLNGKIGPVSASVNRIGMKTALSFPNDGGNLGPMNLDALSFLPPMGAGLVIDTEALVGGGFLEFDHDNKRYAGIMQLEFQAIGLVAIGLITTRMPDGSKGFSMLMAINVTFNPAITLPYNFKLIGVGGLIGIHRSMIIDVIRQGLKNRTLDSIMFPEDPILNAAKIISDLRAVFPPTADRFVVGPMAKLGWNSPPLITGDIGILIEIPQPVRIAILGQLALVLPKKEKAIVEIHLDMLGVIDFDKRLFSFDASLYDSKILTFTLSGDAAMRLSWGEEPNFALAVGGLHPRFKPPPKFPTIRRLRLSIGSGNNPRINLETYQAVTSNSTQFGAKLEVYAKKGKFSIQGYLSFDALFIFSPFSFSVDIGAGVSVKVGRKTLFSISLDLMLAGTSPWLAKGKATFKILFVKIKIRFDKSWGKRKRVSLPEVDPTEQLLTALKDSGNWAGILPAKSQMAVSLRQSEEKTDAIVVHPMGTLEIRQRVLPLGVRLEKFGNAPVTGPSQYTIDVVKTGTEDPGFTPLNLTPVKDHFARGQFENISDAKKISGPSFEKFNAGVRAGSDKIEFDHPVSYTLEYETEVIDENRVAHTIDPSEPSYDPSKLPWRMGKYFVAGSAARLGAMRNAGSRKYSVYGKAAKVRMKEEEYVIVGTKDMRTEQGIPNNDMGMSHSQAQREYEAYVEQNPEKQGEVQIVLKQEVAA